MLENPIWRHDELNSEPNGAGPYPFKPVGDPQDFTPGYPEYNEAAPALFTGVKDICLLADNAFHHIENGDELNLAKNLAPEDLKELRDWRLHLANYARAQSFSASVWCFPGRENAVAAHLKNCPFSTNTVERLLLYFIINAFNKGQHCRDVGFLLTKTELIQIMSECVRQASQATISSKLKMLEDLEMIKQVNGKEVTRGAISDGKMMLYAPTGRCRLMHQTLCVIHALSIGPFKNDLDNFSPCQFHTEMGIVGFAQIADKWLQLRHGICWLQQKIAPLEACHVNRFTDDLHSLVGLENK